MTFTKARSSDTEAIGGYRILRLLGRGGMGEVYLAWTGLRLVAIKLLNEQHAHDKVFAEMFLSEARVAASINHSGIAQVLDVGVDGGRLFMVMEYVAGHTLDELLRDETIPGFFPLRMAASMFAYVAHTLGTAHRAGVVHRDISPHNLLVSDTGAVKIIDFGIARTPTSDTYTSPGTFRGRFGYMAPEYVQSRPCDHRVDLFALGVVMWETFARRRLYTGTAGAQVFAMVERPAPRLDSLVPGFPIELADVVARLLERDPALRYFRGDDVAGELEALVARLPDDGFRNLEHWVSHHLATKVEARLHADREDLLRIGGDEAVSRWTTKLPMMMHRVAKVLTPLAEGSGDFGDCDDFSDFDDQKTGETVVLGPDEVGQGGALAARKAKQTARIAEADRAQRLEEQGVVMAVDDVEDACERDDARAVAVVVSERSGRVRVERSGAMSKAMWPRIETPQSSGIPVAVGPSAGVLSRMDRSGAIRVVDRSGAVRMVERSGAVRMMDRSGPVAAERSIDRSMDRSIDRSMDRSAPVRERVAPVRVDPTKAIWADRTRKRAPTGLVTGPIMGPAMGPAMAPVVGAVAAERSGALGVPMVMRGPERTGATRSNSQDRSGPVVADGSGPVSFEHEGATQGQGVPVRPGTQLGQGTSLGQWASGAQGAVWTPAASVVMLTPSVVTPSGSLFDSMASGLHGRRGMMLVGGLGAVVVVLSLILGFRGEWRARQGELQVQQAWREARESAAKLEQSAKRVQQVPAAQMQMQQVQMQGPSGQGAEGQGAEGVVGAAGQGAKGAEGNDGKVEPLPMAPLSSTAAPDPAADAAKAAPRSTSRSVSRSLHRRGAAPVAGAKSGLRVCSPAARAADARGCALD